MSLGSACTTFAVAREQPFFSEKHTSDRKKSTRPRAFAPSPDLFSHSLFPRLQLDAFNKASSGRRGLLGGRKPAVRGPANGAGWSVADVLTHSTVRKSGGGCVGGLRGSNRLLDGGRSDRPFFF